MWGLQRVRENNTFAHRLGAKSLHVALQREHEKQKSGGWGGGLALRAAFSFAVGVADILVHDIH